MSSRNRSHPPLNRKPASPNVINDPHPQSVSAVPVGTTIGAQDPMNISPPSTPRMGFVVGNNGMVRGGSRRKQRKSRKSRKQRKQRK